MSILSKLWSGAPWYIKLLIPLAILGLLIPGISGTVRDAIEAWHRKKEDKKLKALKDKEAALESRIEDRDTEIDKLEKERDAAHKSADSDDPSNWHNNR